MFNLKKLTLRTKITTVSVIVIFISMGIVYLMNKHSITATKINDWVFITNTSEGNYYYKSNLVNVDDQTHIITVWVKNVYTDKGRQEFLKTHKKDKYKDINRSLSRILINYEGKTYHEDVEIYYANSGNIISSDESSEHRNDLIPKSVGDKLLNKIFTDYNIKR